MAFSISTNKVSAAGDEIKQLASKAQTVLSSVQGYDVNDDEFDFSSAKEAIVENIKNIYEKVNVTSTNLEKIAQTHNNLQNSLDDGSTTSTGTDTTTSGNYISSPASSSSSSYRTTSTPITATPTTTTTTTPTTTTEEKFDLQKLIAAGTIEIIKDEDLEEKTKDKTKLVIRINKNDANYEKYLEMVYKVAKLYGIAVAIILIPDSEKDKTVTVSLVKNGKEEGSIKGEITEDKLKQLFESAPDNVKADYKKENDFVYYKQGDYGNAYAGETIAAAGCGPTAAAMVLTYLTGESVTPPVAATYSEQHGFAANMQGTYESLFPSISNAYGLQCQQQSQTASNILTSLSEGKTIIAHMGPGEFTKGGHYIVLRKTDGNGNVLVADPANPSRNKWYPASIFEQQAGGHMYSIWA